MRKFVHHTHPWLWLLLLAITLASLTSCGTIRTYGGIEHESTYDFDGRGYYRQHKPKKHHKKPKKHHKKHHGHHHHHDHDDD